MAYQEIITHQVEKHDRTYLVNEPDRIIMTLGTGEITSPTQLPNIALCPLPNNLPVK